MKKFITAIREHNLSTTVNGDHIVVLGAPELSKALNEYLIANKISLQDFISRL